MKTDISNLKAYVIGSVLGFEGSHLNLPKRIHQSNDVNEKCVIIPFDGLFLPVNLHFNRY